MRIRNSAKAVIIRDDRLLVIRCHGVQGTFYTLPGGGQEHGETLPEAVKRECLEEAGVEVAVGELLCIREYVAKNHPESRVPSQMHFIEFMFFCSISPEAEAKAGSNPDELQMGVDWLPLDELADYSLHPRESINYLLPQSLREYLVDRYVKKHSPPVYLGDSE